MKPSIPKGTRDFSPDEVLQRNYIFNTIKQVFTKYGYRPIETPTMENLSTLTGKYGEEGDKLLFKVLNNGDYLAKADEGALVAKDSKKLTSSISKRGMRYDLTVPFARYVVMNRNDIALPFKRYQIQPVWRADRPQKGRYQEFYQCDVDVVGSRSLVYEAELVQIYDEVFAALGIKVIIKVNNRKVLAGIAEAAGILDQFVDMTVAIDKLDKIGMDGVKEDMTRRGIPETAQHSIAKSLETNDLAVLKTVLSNSETGLKGLADLDTFFSYLENYSSTNTIEFDPTLARGLSYYTGCIFEVVLDRSVEQQANIRMGSLGGGGRYDDLTGIFGMKDLPGVGVSFGAARIFDVMKELDSFPKENASDLKALFIAFDQAAHLYAFNALTALRQAGINADIYPDPVKMQKQMKYANSRKVPYVILVGSEEMNTGKLTLKNMSSGEQEQLEITAIIEKLN